MKVIFVSIAVTLDLRKFTLLFQDYIEMRLFLPHCFERRLLDRDAIERINGADKHMQVVYLIDMIERKGRRVQSELIACFEAEKEHLGHAAIAEALKKG